MSNRLTGAQQTLDPETSGELARRVRAQYRRCWQNAALSMRHLGNGSQYVEGWIVVERSAPLVIEHGWCEASGRIIDPTYTSYVSALPQPLAYFAGSRFTETEALQGLQRRGLPLVHLRDQQSYNAAFHAALLDAKARRPPQEARPRTCVVHCRREPFDVYIGRPTPWGNPFRIGVDGTREEVIEKFRQWFIRRPTLLRSLETLRGKALGCFCPPEPCHGDVLVELADLGETFD